VDGLALLALRVAVSLAFAVVSYYVLELPIRRGGLAAWRRPVLQPLAAVAAVVALLVVTAGAVERTDLLAVGRDGAAPTLAPIDELPPPPEDPTPVVTAAPG